MSLLYVSRQHFSSPLFRITHPPPHLPTSSSFPFPPGVSTHTVCTLVTGSYSRAIRRLQHLIRDAGRRAYILSVGKPNEPKLLNFPEIEMFVIVACPFSALAALPSLSTSTASALAITAVELELALSPDRTWDGTYSTDFGDLFGASGRIGLKRAEEEEAEERNAKTASSFMSSSSTTRDVDQSNVVAADEIDSNDADDEDAEQDGPESAAATTTSPSSFTTSHTSVDHRMQLGTGYSIEGMEDAFEDDLTAPRFSLVDTRLHTRIDRDEARAAVDALNSASSSSCSSSSALVEAANPGVLTVFADVSYKAYVRSFTGLDGALVPSDMAMRIQPGLHGTARNYTEYAGPRAIAAAAATASTGTGTATSTEAEAEEADVASKNSDLG